MKSLSSFSPLGDRELIDQVKRLAAAERYATAELIASLAEMDARRLYLGEGCSSLFAYCTQVLHLSEHAAYGRIEAARAARKCPIILEALASGSVTVTAIAVLAPHLTAENSSELLAAAHHRSKREVEQVIAALKPKPDVPATIRKLPVRSDPSGANRAAVAEASVPEAQKVADQQPVRSEPRVIREPATSALRPSAPPHAIVAPLTPERFKVQFTISRETHTQLRHAQDLLRHAIPDGDSKAEDATRQPEQIRAFRDTWQLGIHSYLAYLRNRLTAARELLTESGSIFVQIGDENLHLVRAILDEVFGSENFCSAISFKKTTGQSSPDAKTNVLTNVADYLIWYAKNVGTVKYRQLFTDKGIAADEIGGFRFLDALRQAVRRYETDPRHRAVHRREPVTASRPLH